MDADMHTYEIERCICGYRSIGLRNWGRWQLTRQWSRQTWTNYQL